MEATNRGHHSWHGVIQYKPQGAVVHVPFYFFESRDYVPELSFQSETAVDEFLQTFRTNN